MTCGACGNSLAAAETSCPRCGAAAPSSPLQAASEVVPHNAFPLLGMVLTLVVLGGILFLNLGRYGEVSFSLGATIGAGLIPAIAVLLYYRRRKVSTNRRLVAFSAWTVLLFLVSFSSGPRSSLGPSDVPRLAREGLGITGVSAPGTPQEDLIRGFFRDVKALNEAYSQKAAAVEAPQGVELLSPESFADRHTIEQMLVYVDRIAAVDREQEEALAALLPDFEARLQSLDISQHEKKQFLAGFRQGIAKTMGLRQKTMQAELAWLDSLQALYRYGLQNSARVAVREGRLVIEDEDTRTAFNVRWDSAMERHAAFLEAVEAFEKIQRETLGKIDLTPADFGASAEN